MSQVSVEINNQRFDVQSDSSWAQVIADHLGKSLDTSSILAVEVGDHRYDLMATVIPNASAKTLTLLTRADLIRFATQVLTSWPRLF